MENKTGGVTVWKKLNSQTWDHNLRIIFLVSRLFKGVKQLVADRRWNTLYIPGFLCERECSFRAVKKKKKGEKQAQLLISLISDDG